MCVQDFARPSSDTSGAEPRSTFAPQNRSMNQEDAAATDDDKQRAGSIVPGLAMATLILGGAGMLGYMSWREAHPLPEVPSDVEPLLKVPGEVPRALRKSA
jgi:hypothetical protein